ncbi:hypothetical protein GAGA_2421 [Paraglaciecola agarilytica NO2]|uniref:Uncharacterized protein n=1 Tax=Paraglaciecola agarilytica NO2 TaxID=1125747 RepID=A0ABQ0I7E4_9ALTE|nr:hypothetical protein GAGA_2421 [Paraglaciecola agarilytica NO2]
MVSQNRGSVGIFSVSIQEVFKSRSIQLEMLSLINSPT